MDNGEQLFRQDLPPLRSGQMIEMELGDGRVVIASVVDTNPDEQASIAHVRVKQVDEGSVHGSEKLLTVERRGDVVLAPAIHSQKDPHQIAVDNIRRGRPPTDPRGQQKQVKRGTGESYPITNIRMR